MMNTRIILSFIRVFAFITVGLTFININATTDDLDDCMLIIGDSVAYGSAVFEVPGQGFPVIQTVSFAQFVDEELHEIEAFHIGVYDLSVQASSLTGQLPYTTTMEYHFSLDQSCRFIIIFPWLNELRVTTDEAFVMSYIGVLANFVESYRQSNPESLIVLMNYYPVSTTSLGNIIYDGSVYLENIQRVNNTLASNCTSEGMIGRLNPILCMDLMPLFGTSEGNHVFTALDQSSYQAFGYEPIIPDDNRLLDIFWRENPAGLILGDGVHLNETGKSMLAEALIGVLLNYDPTIFDLNLTASAEP